MKKFEIKSDGFYYGNEPMQIISGALHYFRVIPEYWEDRLTKLKLCGLNTVETYVPWNAHEPRPGEFHFEGMLDLVRFIRLAQKLDLLVIVRPSPYICAEWEFGGLPAWLLADPGLQIRCMYGPYIEAIDRYYDELIPMLTPLQCTQGGPVIAMQIENEYGSYGTDKEYLSYLEVAMTKRGVDVPLFTSDGPHHDMLQGGTLPHIFKTANFGSRSAESFETLRKYQPEGPMMCMEFWNGWFDHWGEEHHTRDVSEVTECLDAMLSAGASVNMYMFHGGTNFGFTSGANFDKQYQPTVTSYDYDAPLSESGDPTPKYHAFRDVISRYRELPRLPDVLVSPKAAFGKILLTEQALLLENIPNISECHRLVNPLPMEMLGQASGFILYRTFVSGPRPNAPLILQDVHDRAHVFLDGKFVGVQDRNDVDKGSMLIEIPAQGAKLEILVENMGRINYGPHMLDRKGITQGVRLQNQFLHGWDVFCLPLERLDPLKFRAVIKTDKPAFYRGTFEVDEPVDTFVALDGWTKGVCFINGFNLGRYWNTKPYRNLYLPGPLLKKGRNEIVLFELEGQGLNPYVEFVDHAVKTAPSERIFATTA